MKWIPRSVTIPPEGGTYLVQLVWTDRPEILDFFPDDEYEEDVWVNSDSFYRNKDVEAWMPLPKPYHEPPEKEEMENC